jgi:hypothetical protein
MPRTPAIRRAILSGIIMLTAASFAPAAAPDAIRELTLRAEGGDPAAQLSLAVRFRDGQGVAQDDAAAMQWAHRAAGGGGLQIHRPAISQRQRRPHAERLRLHRGRESLRPLQSGRRLAGLATHLRRRPEKLLAVRPLRPAFPRGPLAPRLRHRSFRLGLNASPRQIARRVSPGIENSGARGRGRSRVPLGAAHDIDVSREVEPAAISLLILRVFQQREAREGHPFSARPKPKAFARRRRYVRRARDRTAFAIAGRCELRRAVMVLKGVCLHAVGSREQTLIAVLVRHTTEMFRLLQPLVEDARLRSCALRIGSATQSRWRHADGGGAGPLPFSLAPAGTAGSGRRRGHARGCRCARWCSRLAE